MRGAGCSGSTPRTCYLPLITPRRLQLRQVLLSQFELECGITVEVLEV